MKFLFILILSFSYSVFGQENIRCTKCIKGEQSCERLSGQILGSKFIRECEMPKTIDDYCTPCVQRSGDDPSKGLRVQEVGTKWISYYVKSKGEAAGERMWCGTKDHSCDEVLKMCEQTRQANPECRGQSNANANTGGSASP